MCSSEDIVKIMKRQATDLDKIFAKLISDKGPVSKIQKDLSKLKPQEKFTQPLYIF